jgi:glycosyltransferase involved in cell wall biosynthesis
MTVLNEAASLPAVLETLMAQTRPADEIVIVDGGSGDGSQELLRASQAYLPLRVLEARGANISQGRNLAIQAATGDVIAATDAGVRLPADWLEHLIAPFAGSAASHVAGFFVSDPRTVFETALGAATLPDVGEIRQETFLPSSRSVAFLKEVWQQAGGYPEWLDYCEDVVFDLRVKAQRGPFCFAPRACVSFRPRPSLEAFYAQYYRYARGDGKADLFLSRHIVRYLTYLIGLPALVWGAVTVTPWIGLIGVFGGGVYLSRAVLRLTRVWDRHDLRDRLRMLLWLPVIIFTGDVAKMSGYPAGVAWRWRRRGVGPSSH